MAITSELTEQQLAARSVGGPLQERRPCAVARGQKRGTIVGKSLGIVAFVLGLIGLFIPVLGPWITVLSLFFAVGSALSGEKTWSVVVAILGGLNLFFFSPSWMFLMYSHHLAEGAGAYGDAVANQQRGTNTFVWYFTLIIVLAPMAIVAWKSFNQPTPPSDTDQARA